VPMWLHSCADCPLTPEGRGQAKAAGLLVPIDAVVYTSPFLRCRQTAHLIITQGSPRQAIVDTALTEHLNPDWFNEGVFDFFNEHHVPLPFDTEQTLLKGHLLSPEDDAAYGARAAAVYDSLKASDSVAPVVLVTHGGFLHNFLDHHAKVSGETRLLHDKMVQYADVYAITL